MTKPVERNALEKFVHEGCEAALEEIIREHINLVYSVALRALDGRQDLAADVAQKVFIDFIAKAPSFSGERLLAPWFHRAARLRALEVRREEHRRLRREEKAEGMPAMNTSEETTAWEELRPALDEALDELGEPERQALILRFFQQQTFRQVGQVLGVSEDSARMRVQRALEALRRQLACRRVTSTAGALATLLTGHAITPAPAALFSTVLTALPASITAPATLGLMSFATSSTVKIVASIVVAVSLAVPLTLQVRRNGTLQRENTRLAGDLAAVQARLQEARAESTAALNELSVERTGQDELLRLRGLVSDLRRQLENPPPPGVARATANPEGRDQAAVLQEGPKVLVFGEMNAVVPLSGNKSANLAEVLTELPRSQFADLKRVRIYRRDSLGGSTTNVINVENILRHGDPDFVLADGDRVEVRPRTFNF